MEGTPHLLTDVKFSERRRGYAPEEVDNFLERVSAAVAQLQDKLRDATARAEEADARINEAKRAQTVAEAQVDQLKAELTKASEGAPPTPTPAPAPAPRAATGDPVADAEAASTLLLMAKKTADATIEDARNEAETTLADAQSRAATLVTDAEAESTRIRTDAERIAEDLVHEQRAAALAEVLVLEELKGSIQADIDALQRHVDRERGDLRAAVARLSEVIDNPAALRVGAAPVGDTPGIDALVAPAAGVEAIDEVDDVAPVADDLVSDTEPDAEPDVVGRDEDSAVDGESTGAEPELEGDAEHEGDGDAVGGESGESGQADAAIDVDVVDITDDASDEPVVAEAEAGAEAETEATSDAEADAEVEAGPTHQLFADESETDVDGPPTQAFQPFADDVSRDGFDAPRDEDEDKAMRAFFETDFESMEADKRSRWRR